MSVLFLSHLISSDAFVDVLDASTVKPPETPKPEPPKLPPKLASNFVVLDIDINAYVEGVQKNEPMALVDHDFKIQVRLIRLFGLLNLLLESVSVHFSSSARSLVNFSSGLQKRMDVHPVVFDGRHYQRLRHH